MISRAACGVDEKIMKMSLENAYRDPEEQVCREIWSPPVEVSNTVSSGSSVAAASAGSEVTNPSDQPDRGPRMAFPREA